MPLVVFFGFTKCVLLNDDKINTGCLWPLGFVLNNILTLGILQFCNLNSKDVFLSGSSFRISDSTWYHRTPLCYIYILYQNLLQGSFGLCNWLFLWHLVPWINKLPPVCWSTFSKSTFIRQLGCRFDIMDCKSSLFYWYFNMSNCICLYTSYEFLALYLHLK